VNVICAGGTTIRRNNSFTSSFGNFEQETPWVFTGGGISSYEPLPSYQTAIGHCTAVSTTRCVPDLSFDADPYTGVYVYDTFPLDGFYYYQWVIVGGTSVSAPSLAGIINVAQQSSGYSNSPGELAYIYNNRNIAADFTPITNGFCGFYMGTSAPASGFGFCNGIGVNASYGGK